MAKAKDSQEDNVRGHSAVTINRGAQELYAYWRDIEKAPLWQEGLESVTPLSEKTSRWIMKAPLRRTIEWISEITTDIPGRQLSWGSTDGDIEQHGEVTFTEAPAGRGTIVTLVQSFKLTGGKLANATAGAVARSPKQMVIENLRHFKQMTEAGEIPTTENQPAGPRGIGGKMKEFFFGETNPTPPGTAVQTPPGAARKTKTSKEPAASVASNARQTQKDTL